MGGRNHFPGVSGHWDDYGAREGSFLRSGDPLGISRMKGGKSSRGMREVVSTASCWSSRRMRKAGLPATCWSSHGMREAKFTAGGSSPTSRMRSGRAESGSNCG